jgi:hypothetical protein
VTPEGSIQAPEIIATHQRTSRKRRTQRFLGTAIGQLENFQEQIHRHLPPPMVETGQFCQLKDNNKYLDFKLSPRSESCVLSSG